MNDHRKPIDSLLAILEPDSFQDVQSTLVDFSSLPESDQRKDDSRIRSMNRIFPVVLGSGNVTFRTPSHYHETYQALWKSTW